MADFTAYWEAKAKIERRILALEDQYESEALEMQRRLFRYFDEATLSKLELDASGNIAASARNWRLVRNMDDAWGSYQNRFMNPTFKGIGDDMIGITALSRASFAHILPDVITTVDHMTEARNMILQQLGLTAGRGGALSFIPDGFLDRLAQGNDIRDALKELARQNITASSSFRDFYRRFHDAIQGNEQVNGAMQRYFRTYVYDAFSGVHASYDNYVARAAKLDKFIYAGTIIADSRPFCVEHCNRIYSRKDLAEWETQDWKGKNRQVPVIISRGGYNCRHQLAWITDEMAQQLKDGDVDTQPQEVKQPPRERKARREAGSKGKEMWDSMLSNAGRSLDFNPMPRPQKKTLEESNIFIWRNFGRRMQQLGIKTDAFELDEMARMLTRQGWEVDEMWETMNAVLEGFARFTPYGLKLEHVSFIPGDFGGWWQTLTRIVNINVSCHKYNSHKTIWKSLKGLNNRTHGVTGILSDCAIRDTVLHEMSHALSLIDWRFGEVGGAIYRGKNIKRMDLFEYLLSRKYMGEKWTKENLYFEPSADGKRWVTRLIVEDKKELIKRITSSCRAAGKYNSSYSTTNLNELFAECHCGIMQGLEYDAKLMEVFREWYASLVL